MCILWVRICTHVVGKTTARLLDFGKNLFHHLSQHNNPKFGMALVFT